MEILDAVPDRGCAFVERGFGVASHDDLALRRALSPHVFSDHLEELPALDTGERSDPHGFVDQTCDVALEREGRLSTGARSEKPSSGTSDDQTFALELRVGANDRAVGHAERASECPHRWKGMAFGEFAAEDGELDGTAQLLSQRNVVFPLQSAKDPRQGACTHLYKYSM
jgi:hypothetical protein